MILLNRVLRVNQTGLLSVLLGVIALGMLMAVPPVLGVDCNANGIDDECDIDCGVPGGPCDVPGCGQSSDLNSNGIPDECETSSFLGDIVYSARPRFQVTSGHTYAHGIAVAAIYMGTGYVGGEPDITDGDAEPLAHQDWNWASFDRVTNQRAIVVYDPNTLIGLYTTAWDTGEMRTFLTQIEYDRSAAYETDPNTFDMTTAAPALDTSGGVASGRLKLAVAPEGGYNTGVPTYMELPNTVAQGLFRSDNVWDMTVDAQGNLYVAGRADDQSAGKIMKITKNDGVRSLSDTLGGRIGEGHFTEPATPLVTEAGAWYTGIDTDDRLLYVVDCASRRIKAFDMAGNPVGAGIDLGSELGVIPEAAKVDPSFTGRVEYETRLWVNVYDEAAVIGGGSPVIKLVVLDVDADTGTMVVAKQILDGDLSEKGLDYAYPNQGIDEIEVSPNGDVWVVDSRALNNDMHTIITKAEADNALTVPDGGLVNVDALGAPRLLTDKQFYHSRGAAFPPGFVDCNNNGVPDDEDISTSTSQDINGNSVPDECEPDCNANGVPDDWDIATATSQDVNSNGVPDECEPDCNGNGVPDDWDISQGTSQDCNANDMPDECDIATGTSQDCNTNGVPDECDPDCNTNAVPDDWDIAQGTSQDCNTNGIPDECEIDIDVVVNGDFADGSSSWQMWTERGGASFDFNSSNCPAGGSAPCLRMTSSSFNGGVYQEFDLVEGTEYTVEVLSRDLGSTPLAWASVLVGTQEPQDGSDYVGAAPPGTILLLKWDTTTCSGWDGGPDTACVIAQTTFTATAETMYIVLKCGSWPELVDVAFDNVSVFGASGKDCNDNGILDECDIAAGTSQDINSNGVPDECEPDCNENGLPDNWDISQGTSQDCNGNVVPDECDIAAGTSQDCNANGVPDECDISAGTSQDVNGNGIPDECEDDCNGNGVPDDWDISTGTSLDCNGNGVPDECDIAAGTSQDVNANSVPDECEPDCNANDVPDDWDISTGTSLDCNGNGVPDDCDIAAGTSQDQNTDGIPDECQLDVRIVPVVGLIDPGSTSEVRSDLPESLPAVVRGSTYYVEIWASDVGETNTGLTGVYVDLSHCQETSATSLHHGTIFTTFTDGAIVLDGVNEFGGSALPSGGGIEPQWVRVGWITMTADVEVQTCAVSILPSTSGVAALNRGLIDWLFVELGSVDLEILPPARSYDLDDDSFIGVGDLSLFAGSWLQAVPPGAEAHDFDCDAYVGVGDLSWFATGWMKSTDDPSILYPPCSTGGASAAMFSQVSADPLGDWGAPLGLDSSVDVDYELVVLATPSGSDTTTALPTSLGTIQLGQTYYLEVWVSDVGDVNTGLTSAYVDLIFPAEAASVTNVSHGGIFTAFPSGAVGAGVIDELGGSALPGGDGVAPQWARVAVVQMHADAAPPAVTFALEPGQTGTAALARGVIPWDEISLDTVMIGQPLAQLVSTEPAADGTLPKTQNNVITLVFDIQIAMPGGSPLSIVELADPNNDVSGSFTYSADPNDTGDPTGATLKATENGVALLDQTWYQVSSAPNWATVTPFAFDFCTLRGDANNSSRVTTADYSEVKSHMGERTDARYDLNGSARITTADYSVVKANMAHRAPAKP